MTPFSVYGYNLEMLVPARPTIQNPIQPPNAKYHQLRHGSQTCPFLNLPTELRMQIYGYLLPYTARVERGPEKEKDVVWVKGNITILLANRTIYNEAIQVLYATATFDLELGGSFSHVVFAKHWLYSTGTVSKWGKIFLDTVSPRNRALIRRFRVKIFNVASPKRQLDVAVERQVEVFCHLLREQTEIAYLHIQLAATFHKSAVPAASLDGFLLLRTIRVVELSGSFQPSLRQRLQSGFHDAFVESPRLRLQPLSAETCMSASA